MSYFKYAERSSESRVDWNEISKGMVDMLKEQTRLRNEKLDEAVKLQGEVTTTLSDAPMGSDVNANQRVSQFAADAQEYSLMMNKLWRSGEMSYREYMAATNNFKTNTEGYLSQAEKYAVNYEKHVKRMEEKIASGVEVSELARVEDFGNFSRFTPVIDAPTGSIGLVGEDGTKYASVSQLGVAVMSTYDRLDVEGRTTEVADQMGKTVEVIKSGKVLTLESALQNENYVAAEDEAVSGILNGDNAYTSVLVDFKLGLYSTTHDINDAINDPNAILMVPSSRNSDRMIGAVEDDAAFERYIDEQATRNGQPLTDGEKAVLRKNRDAQREQSFEAVRDQLRARLNFVETPRADRPPRTDSNAGNKSMADDGVNNLQAIWTATDEEVLQAALNYFEGQNEGLDLEVFNDEDGVRTLAIKREGEDESRLIPVNTDYKIFVEAVAPYVMKTTYLSRALEKNPLAEGASAGSAVGEVTTARRINRDDVGSEEVTYDDDGKLKKQDFRTFIANLPEPGGRSGNSDTPAMDAAAQMQGALSELGLDDIEVSAILEDNLESMYGYTIRYPGIRISSPNMENDIVVSYDSSDYATLGAILEEIATGKFLSSDELLNMMGSESQTITKYLVENNMLGGTRREFENPDESTAPDNTQEEDPLGIL